MLNCLYLLNHLVVGLTKFCFLYQIVLEVKEDVLDKLL
jgi:hypothetical protein